MAYFPANPTVGQTYTIGAITWTWNGSGWLKGASAAALNTTVSATAPQNPNPGDIWIDNTDGVAYTYIDDGDTAQWVDI